MLEERLVIKNKLGLHARPAALFVQTANSFFSEIRVIKDGLEINGKSVMGLMMMAAQSGCELTIKIWGDDEKKAMKALKELFDRKFDEE